MKVVQVNSDNGIGGAARAATRLHEGLRSAGVSSTLLVRSRVGGDDSVKGPATFIQDGLSRIRPYISSALYRLEVYPLQGFRSLNVFPTRLGRQVRDLEADVVHLHQLSKETMSISQLGRIRKPLVWTFHDMWAFCGTEHYSPDETALRYKVGYDKTPAAEGHSGVDLDRWIWKRKKKYWAPEKMTVVTPSRWLGDCVRSSALFGSARIEVIPNGIDTSLFKPADQLFARKVWNLPPKKPLILFGAMKATSDSRKGFRLLDETLHLLREQIENSAESPELVVFGATQTEGYANFPLPTHYVGRIHDEVSLCLLYSAADVFVAPSMQDNLPNTVVEALACGTPAVAFKIGGMPDMIEHEQNGYLARPFEVSDLAQGIQWVLGNADRHRQLSQQARQKVEQEFTIQLQVARCKTLYQDVVDNMSKKRIQESEPASVFVL